MRTAATPLAPTEDAALSAHAAGLRYVTDAKPGIRRVRAGKGFRYVAPDGRTIDDEATLRRIRALAVPPAYRDVWICLDDRGHLQATGRDARGRKQYRYHPAWRLVRDSVKYDRLLAFAEALPKIRARVSHDLSRPGLPREKVVAAVVRLLEATRMRVGNEEYRRANDSYGLTTLEERHVLRVSAQDVKLRFRGKGGREHAVAIHDRRLARVIRRCLEIPGQELFHYVAHDGERHTIGSGDVNAYLHEAARGGFTAKDFRTWAGTVLAAEALRVAPSPGGKRAAQRAIVDAIARTASSLGNTPAVCRRSYVHPAVIDAYARGLLHATPRRLHGRVAPDDPCALRTEERFVVRLLRASIEVERAREDLEGSLTASLRKRPGARRAA